MSLMGRIRANAKKLNKRIVLAEGTEERTLKAADFILKEEIANITLIGKPEQIQQLALDHTLNHLGEARVIDPSNYPEREEYSQLLFEIRKAKGMTKDEAYQLCGDPLYLASLMIKTGAADGEVAGALRKTADVLRPAFQIIRTAPGFTIVSGAFIMILRDTSFGDDGVMLFADCAVHPNPSEKELAEIAVATAYTAQKIAGIDPRVALLSFSTKGSASHHMVDKVATATRMAREMAPLLRIDGELQADAAIVDTIGKKKAPGSLIAGKANVLVFPSMESGNIAYKLVQRIAHAEAIGPILQGLAAPVNNLSSGCSVEDIINMIAITALQAGNNKL
ncbi:MAG: phosphate acetyltransferase [Bacteroidota bacterium]